MRIFRIENGDVVESADLAALTSTRPPTQGFVWAACARDEFEATQVQIQAMLQAQCGQQLVDLHISDLLNNQLPSHYDYTSQSDSYTHLTLPTIYSV